MEIGIPEQQFITPQLEGLLNIRVMFSTISETAK